MRRKSSAAKAYAKAYTLVEMLVSISLIVIITALFIANYNAANKRTDLVMLGQKLVADFHAAQNNTLGLVKYNDDVPAGGWGLHFDMAQADRYVVFADLNGPDETGYMSYDSDLEGNQDYGARTVTFPPNLELSNLSMGLISVDQADVTFLPPDPQTNIHSSNATSTSLQVQLRDKRNNTYRTVQINFLGLAEVIF